MSNKDNKTLASIEVFLQNTNNNIAEQWWEQLSDEQKKRLFCNEHKSIILQNIDHWYKNLDSNIKTLLLEYLKTTPNSSFMLSQSSPDLDENWHEHFDENWQNLLAQKFNITKNSRLQDVSFVFEKTNTLDISGFKIQDITPLKFFKSLEYLSCYNNRIDVIGFSSLSYLHSLKELHLYFTNILDLSPLVNMQELEYLSLNGTKVLTLESLFGLKKLKTLYIKDCPNLSSRNIQAFKEAVPECKVITQ